MTEELMEYFKGDELAASVWEDKYCLKNEKGELMEKTPDDMHQRMAKEFARIEQDGRYNDLHFLKETAMYSLSDFGKRFVRGDIALTEDFIYTYLKDFKYIIPQGSIMAMLGNPYKVGSLSNCFVIPPPVDSYGGILLTDQELVQLMKRRGGVGTNLNRLRFIQSQVRNAAGSSTGTPSFASRYSNSTNEVAQDGRRGALMLLLTCLHPDIFDWVKMKDDRTKVTGANVSTMLTNKFMEAAEANQDFMCQFPVDYELSEDEEEDGALNEWWAQGEYNKIWEFKDGVFFMKIHARELFDLIIEMAWKNGEPGLAFMDTIHNYSPDGVYEAFKAIAANPCFHPDTLIETVEGQIKIKDITEPIRVYSMDKDGKLTIRQASASFISKKNAETIRIEVGSGNFIIVTKDHKLFVHDKGWVEANNIKIGDRIGHLSRYRRGASYSGVYLTTSPNGRNDQVMEHRLVADEFREEYDVHHLDRNTYNNNIHNLQILAHNSHSRVTATEDNPQIHQVRNARGNFISSENSRMGKKTIVNLPEHLKTNMKNQNSNRVISITESENSDVYDIQVEDTHCLIANNLVAHNCGEQWLQAYDSCRLLALNLLGIVINPFTKDAHIDYDKLYEIAYIQQRLADDIVDLEIEHIERILTKIDNDPEPEEVKHVERNLWTNILRTAKAGRRTGCGFTGLGDMLAMLGLKYDSAEGIATIEKVAKIKMQAELDCTIDLAILRGTFEGWNPDLEFDKTTLVTGNTIMTGANNFYQMLLEEFPEQINRMIKFGRRNVSWSTIAPTGSLSVIAKAITYSNITGGMEPSFFPYYFRNRKIVPGAEGTRVDFIDQNGVSWQQYPVVMGAFKDWYDIVFYDKYKRPIEELSKDEIEYAFECSPWFGSTANDIDWTKRVEIQAVLQKYTTNAISSTINLPENVAKEEVAKIYWAAWKAGLKGITVYRDKSRTGVLVNEAVNQEPKFSYKDAMKRPKELNADLHIVTVKGEKYGVIISTLDNNPYEVFAFHTPEEEIVETKGIVKKVKKGHYDFMSEEGRLRNLQDANIKPEEQVLTRLVSGMLRHSTDPKYIIEQINKCPVEIVGFGKAVSRVLKKYIQEGEESTTICTNCGGSHVVYQEGCLLCRDCGNSRCG